ncbi:MAG: Prenylcysteine lyase-domain-containing protein [Monoraphidium minutum]|nr:MAG: Prenylcysteine lyase-domain-containing protein [Monoraphidium minutum]
MLLEQHPDVEVSVFERAQSVGGRAKEMAYGGPGAPPQELGASIIHGSNQIILGLALAANLTVEPAEDSGGGAMGIFDGEGFVLQLTNQPVLDMLRLLRRYGLAPVRYGQLAKDAGRAFASIYSLQDNGCRAFEMPREMLGAMGLWELTQQNAADHLRDNLKGLWGYGAARFAAELAGSVDKVNYNQPISHMNAMAALVSYLPAADPRLYRVAGGNGQLPAKLLEAAAAAGRARPAGPFDAVVIAAPLESAGLALSGLDPPPALPSTRFQLTVTTYIEGALNATTFKGLAPGADVFVTADAPTKFSCIALKGPCAAPAPAAAAAAAAAPDGGAGASDTGSASAGGAGGAGGCGLFKVFSRSALTAADVDALFAPGRVVDSAPWLAYPKFSPPEEFAPFQLAPGLVYQNALENAASAMEVSAVAAKNSALLVAGHLRAREAAAAALSAGTRAAAPAGASAGGGARALPAS